MASHAFDHRKPGSHDFNSLEGARVLTRGNYCSNNFSEVCTFRPRRYDQRERRCCVSGWRAAEETVFCFAGFNLDPHRDELRGPDGATIKLRCMSCL
jgi:hypothetical protein